MPDSPPPPPLPESTSRRSRSRSRSPPRQPKKSSTGGFRWKEKRPERGGHRDREGGGGGGGGEDARRLDRGYRARSPRREYDPRDRREYSSRDDGRDARDRDRERDRGYGYRDRERDYPRDRDRDRRDSYQPRDRDRDDRTRDRDRESYNPRARDRPENPTATSTDNSLQKEKKEKKKKRPAIPSEPMILVHVNDRLGTKATVPCLPSDTVGDLKTLVAAQIGRAPREILLKRQGERPFKDFISLGDYGITNGVQLDLEIGTGD